MADFYDRIHYVLELPTVDNPGQAILTFLSTLKQFLDADCARCGKELPEVDISEYVLRLFGGTVWTSARQINTICRLVYSQKDREKQIRAGETVKLQLEDFSAIADEVIGVSGIKDTYNALKEKLIDARKLKTKEEEEDFVKIIYPTVKK